MKLTDGELRLLVSMFQRWAGFLYRACYATDLSIEGSPDGVTVFVAWKNGSHSHLFSASDLNRVRCVGDCARTVVREVLTKRGVL